MMSEPRIGGEQYKLAFGVSTNDGSGAVSYFIGASIESIKLVAKAETSTDQIIVVFSGWPGESELVLLDDDGQCCEERFITAETDDLDYYVGATLLDVEVSDVAVNDEPEALHEVRFLNIHTSKGVVTFATHNKHNGYYGGFDICALRRKCVSYYDTGKVV